MAVLKLGPAVSASTTIYLKLILLNKCGGRDHRKEQKRTWNDGQEGRQIHCWDAVTDNARTPIVYFALEANILLMRVISYIAHHQGFTPDPSPCV